MPSRTIIRDVRISDGESALQHGFSIVGEDGCLEKVDSRDPPDDQDGTILSKPGHTLLPGSIDAHIHADHGNETALPQSLRFGVTTVCDMGIDPQHLRRLFKQIKRDGDGVCADIKTTHFAATVDGGWPMAVVMAYDNSPATLAELAQWPRLKTPEDGRSYVKDML